jgi:hypothetical protein
MKYVLCAWTNASEANIYGQILCGAYLTQAHRF